MKKLQNIKSKSSINKYISKLNKLSNKFAFNNIDYLKENSLDNLRIDMNDEEVMKFEEIVRRDIFSKNYFLSLIDINNQ